MAAAAAVAAPTGRVSRGPGAADMYWGRPAPGSTDDLGVEALPQAEFLDPESTTLLGVAAGTPQAKPLREGSAAATGTDGTATGSAAWRRRLSPRHRDAVRTFFEER